MAVAVAVADAETGDLSRMLRPVTCDLRPAACETEGKEKQGWTGTTNGEGACVPVCVCVCVCLVKIKQSEEKPGSGV